MKFKLLTLDCIDALRPFFEQNLCRICDCTIGGTFMWRDFFHTEYAIDDGYLFIRAKYLTGDSAFTPPIGEGWVKKIEVIREYCAESGVPARLCVVSENRLKEIRRIYPDAEASTDRAWSDYLYNSSDIRDLPGRKFSGQRNHINRFQREYADWSFEKIKEENIDETRDFFERYTAEHIKDSETYDEGNAKTIEMLDNYDRYRLLGGVLRVSGEIVGASLGEAVGDTLFIHIEKSKTEYEGSYPMLVNQFAKAFAGSEILYINREEDDGNEGLRTSKLSYHPVKLLDKYVVKLP